MAVRGGSLDRTCNCHHFGLSFSSIKRRGGTMNVVKTGTVTAAMALSFVTMSGYAAAAPPEAGPSEQAQVMKGTIQGEVKKVQPDAVIVEVDADKADKKEVRLPLNQSTHMGPIG